MKNQKAAKKPSRVIKFRQSLFWDVDPKTIDPNKHSVYVIERILDFGNDQEVHWLANYYSSKKIKRIVDRSRVLHKKSKALWSLVFR